MKDRVNELMEELDYAYRIQGEHFNDAQQLLFEALEYIKGDAIKPEIESQ